jgi:hypothetical protein
LLPENFSTTFPVKAVVEQAKIVANLLNKEIFFIAVFFNRKN